TFVHVIQSTSTLFWSTSEVKRTVRTVEVEVTLDVDTDGPPGNAGAAPFKSVRTAAHPEISSPDGMLLKTTLTCTLDGGEAGDTPPVLNCELDLKKSG